MDTMNHGTLPQPDELRRYVAEGRRLQAAAARHAFARVGRTIGRSVWLFFASAVPGGRHIRHA